jgi:tRNA-dihydrouridine synthase A
MIPSYRFSVAPMLDWTDRHCRFFHRQLTQHALLYTEMITTGALLRGDQHRHLDFSETEHPLALQLGGSDIDELTQCVKLAQKWGYDEVNLNCGCPSERVQRGSFGACLMAEPKLVADCVKAMRDACDLEITVKHRIGLDDSESYEFVRDFVGAINEAGTKRFIVHARNAWLKGLSPRENREVPPLRYEIVQRLKRDFPDVAFVLNGGLRTHDQIADALTWADGVMVGREAYENPWMLSEVDALYFGGQACSDQTRAQRSESVVECMSVYTNALVANETRAREQTLSSVKKSDYVTNPRSVIRHMLGLYRDMPGARAWRRALSQPASFKLPVTEQFALARLASADASMQTRMAESESQLS